MRVGQLVQIVEDCPINYDAENGAVIMTARDTEEVLQIISFRQEKDVTARVYSPEQYVTFDIPVRYLKANEFVSNEDALQLYIWPLQPFVTVSLVVKPTDRQAILPLLPEPRMLPAPDIDKLPYYQEAGAALPFAEDDQECEEKMNEAPHRAYTRKRAVLEALAVIVIAVAVYLIVSNF